MIYLDNAATTRVSENVLEAMDSYLREEYGNPSSLHSKGMAAKRAVEEARESVRRLINARPEDNIIFTSGGTEANNLVIKGMSPAISPWGRRTILTTPIEHASVYNPCQNLIDEGIQVLKVPTDKRGVVDLETLETILHWNNDVGLVSIMTVNNEIGSIQPISEIGKICKKYCVAFHTDAVQAVGHIAIDVQKDNIDFLSISGHKFHAPKGVGAVYVRRGIPFQPISSGGHQEFGLRAGTENVAGIVGLGVAARDAADLVSIEDGYYEMLTREFLQKLADAGINYFTNGAGVKSIISLTIPGCESEAMVHLLDQRGVCVSTGSACDSGSLKPSRVLTAIGLTEREAACTIRISMSRYTEYHEMMTAAECVVEVAKNLQTLN